MSKELLQLPKIFEDTAVSQNEVNVSQFHGKINSLIFFVSSLLIHGELLA